MSSTALVFPPIGFKLKQNDLDKPVVVENVFWVDQISCLPGSYIYYGGNWFIKQASPKRSLFKPTVNNPPLGVHEARVPKTYIAWALILV